MFTVAIYLVDKCYGGPEEGGWYYISGEPSDEHCQYTKGFVNESDACTYCIELDAICRDLNKGRPSISSVISQGKYSAEVREGQPKSYPTERPIYE
jgi:hypothetical protein